LYNRSVIEQAPLQLYSSALVFAPEKSIVQRRFEDYIPLWIQRKPKVQADWSACLQTLEGHGSAVNSVNFSHDGSQVASGSWDNTVKIWDASSGACLQTLEGHGGAVNSVAFSHDGSQVASGSDDRTVKIWDASSGACLQTLDVGGTVSNISFDTPSSYVRTDIGTFSLNTSPASTTPALPKSQHQGYGLSADGVWITWNGRNVLWLPAECRPGCSAITAFGVATGCASGRVLITNLSEA
jgi:WD40 repeat protein